MLVDKDAIQQIIGNLMNDPLLLSETDRYSLSPLDFETSFEKYLFSAIHNLFLNGAHKISVVDIDNYLKNHDGAYSIFTKENGVEYLIDAQELAQKESFSYYYNRIKKLNVLNDLKKMGYNTSKIYQEDLLDTHQKEINEKFELLQVSDIFNKVKLEISTIEEKFSTNQQTDKRFADEGIEDLIDQLRESPDIGPRLQGDIFNTICRGGRKGKFFLRSGSQASGKSRAAVGDACLLAYPVRYSSKRGVWEYNGDCEKVLFVVTEQGIDEIQTMILAYLSDINEEKILYGKYSEEERQRLKKAVKIMKEYSENFYLVSMADPTISSIRALVRQTYLSKGVDCFFYDYIFYTPSLLVDFPGIRLRDDVVLMMLSNALKELAKELQIFVMSSTQLNAEAEQKKGIKDVSCLRGARSLGDKIDIGGITLRTTPEELNILSEVSKKYGLEPNQVTDIYKVRQGRHTNVRIWSYFDYGTCRKKDLFLTDANFNEVQDFQVFKFLFKEEELAKYNDFINDLNEGVAARPIAPRPESELREKLEEIIHQTSPQIPQKEEFKIKTNIPSDWRDL